MVKIFQMTIETPFNPDRSTVTDQELYRNRLKCILDGFLQLTPEETTSQWRHHLRQAPISHWVAAIDRCTLDPFKNLLSTPHPPTAKQLKALSYIKSDRPGVYLSVIERKDRTGHAFVYIGSATSPYGGLHYRVSQHKSLRYSAKAA